MTLTWSSFKHAHVDFNADRRRGAEENVADLGGDHGSSPTVGQGGTADLFDEVLGILIHADMGAAHHLHDFAHGAPGNDAVLAPHFQGFGRDALGKGDFTLHLGVGFFQLMIQVHGNVLDTAPLGLDADLLGDRFQFADILDAVVLDLALDHIAEDVQHGHAVVVVAGRSGGDHAAEVARLDGIDGGPADTHLAIGILGIHPAGSHEAVFATGRIGTDGAGLHVDRPVKMGLDTVETGL